MAKLVFVDTETTGLDPTVAQAYEFCYWPESAPEPITLKIPHTLEGASAEALDVGGYFDRPLDGLELTRARFTEALRALRGATLVGSSPAFDAGFMQRRIFGVSVWSHRLVNVADGAMWLFGWPEPRGLSALTVELRSRGFEIPSPDHTAEGDVRATRAVYYAMRSIRARMLEDANLLLDEESARAFRRAWKAADEAGQVGHRVPSGLAAVHRHLTTGRDLR